ncbi:MAG: sodium-dependent transporter [bacterium]|nr:sodium-dependent transporter [bacterium]
MIYYALGQAFFSLSLGMGAMITYGSYISKKENLPSATGWVAFFDTFIAIMAGFIIFPAIFSQGMDPAGGPGLVFNILPVIFAKMPGGVIFGSLFFALLCIAALTSTVSLLEVPVSYLIDEKKYNRKKCAYALGFVALIFAIPSALSAGGVKFLTKLPFLKSDMSFLGLMDYIWGNLSLSIGALFISIFVGYVWKASNAIKEVEEGAPSFKLAKAWLFSIKYLAPAMVLVILVGIILYGT